MPDPKILVLNLPGPVLKCGSRWYNVTKGGSANLRYYPYPWFMGYAVSLLKSRGFAAKLLDAVAMELSDDETIKRVLEYAPTHIVCEPTWVSAERDRAFLDSIPGPAKIAVGNYATNYPQDCLARSGVHMLAVGEYEAALLEYFQSDGKDLPASFLSPDKPDFQMPELVKDLDFFPFPEREDVPYTYYNEPSCMGKNMVMVSSRGCRLKCDFCNVESIYGRHVYRTRSAASVVDEMEQLFAAYDFDEIYFDDDNMVSSKKHVDGICKEIIRRGAKVPFLCMGDGLVDDETLGLLAQAGCTTYKFGLEHLDPDVLKAIPKPLKPERLLGIIKTCRRLGMRSYANLIIGLPGATYEKDHHMLTRVIAAGPDLLQLAIATPYPGTTFFAKARERGWLASDDPTSFDATGATAVSYPDYPADKIIEMFHLGWQMWYKHALIKQPRTMLFFIRSEIRRNGLAATGKKMLSYGLKMLRGKMGGGGS